MTRVLVMLHGCIQPPSEFAVATRMNEAAAARGWRVLWPEQSIEAHELRCWNWYLPEHQGRDRGEPARIAEEIGAVTSERVFVCGISAGAAMTAVLAANYPDLVDAVAMHSGVAFGVANSISSALTIMRDGAGNPEPLGRRVHEAMGERARVIQALVLHGGKDVALNPQNGMRLAQQWAIANRLAAGKSGELAEPAEAMHREDGRYDATVFTYEDAVEEWRIPMLGHAWSGGAAEATYTDPKGPDATAAVLDFFARATG
jgi:poly(hydroxyalkanoate) depolymerase family esterase